MKKHYLAEGMLLLATLIWGSSFSYTTIILDSGTAPLTLMMNRSMVAFITILPLFIYIVIKKGFRWIDMKYGIILGIYVYIGFVFQTTGQSYTTPSKNAFLTTLNVIFVPLILFIFYRKKIDKYNTIAAIVALIGAFVMSGAGFNYSIDNRMEAIGDLLTFISAIFWAVQIIKTGEYIKKVNNWVLMFYEFVTMFFLSVITVYVFNIPLYVAVTNIKYIVYLAIFCSVVSFGLMNYGMKYTSPEKSALIFTFEGAFGAMFAYLLGIERVNIVTIIGGLCILFALIISETKLKFLKNTKLFTRLSKSWYN